MEMKLKQHESEHWYEIDNEMIMKINMNEHGNEWKLTWMDMNEYEHETEN